MATGIKFPVAFYWDFLIDKNIARYNVKFFHFPQYSAQATAYLRGHDYMNDFRISNPASFISFIASGYFLTQSPTVKKVARKTFKKAGKQLMREYGSSQGESLVLSGVSGGTQWFVRSYVDRCMQ